jgi:hypothetical protein
MHDRDDHPSDPFEDMREQIHREAADERQRPYPEVSGVWKPPETEKIA